MHTQLNLPTQLDMIDLNDITHRFDEAINVILEPKLDALLGKQILFSSDEKEFRPLEGWDSKKYFTNINIINAIDETAIVAAIDSSCLFIGETADGSIYSAKCGLALAYRGKPIMHFKIGPMLFYINEDSVVSSNINKKLWKFVLFDTATAKRMIRVRIERLLQNEVCRLLTNTIILVDGSLKRSIFEDKQNSFNNILQNCEVNKNKLLGISKTTKFKILDQFASSLMRNKDACYVDVSSIVNSLTRNVIGKPLLVKLNNNGLILRIDVLKDPRESLGRLVTNDVITNGYPETLRLAHHISIFTRTDVICLKSFILSKFGMKEMMCEDVRGTLLGTFL
ncbi:MAG: hypothetical protein EX285_00395 [Thaumarchaeota archaeon]|nr:hypothetical protein [Nitrososphaerota archaeon]